MRAKYLLILLILFSCKKKDNPEPTISITSPVSGSNFYPGDTIHVEADISDNNPLSTATLKLLNASYAPVDHQESFSINASSYHVSYDYVIENNYLETGNYFINLFTTDGENDVNGYQSIFIHEIPRTRKAVYVITKSGMNNLNVNILDSSGQMLLKTNVMSDYSGSEINSRYNQLVIAGNTTGGINGIDLTNYNIVFSEPTYNGTLPSFLQINAAHDYAFVSYFDGRIKGFDKEGHPKFNSAQPVSYQPNALCVNDKYVFAEAYYLGSGDNRLVVINYPSGEARQELNLGFDIASMMSRGDNDVIIFGNNNGDGKIYFYHVISNGINDFHTLFGNPINSAVEIDDDHYAIATMNGLYSYQESNNNLIALDASRPVYTLEYDSVNSILFANDGRSVSEYNFQSGALLNSFASADSVLEVRILYSK